MRKEEKLEKEREKREGNDKWPEKTSQGRTARN